MKEDELFVKEIFTLKNKVAIVTGGTSGIGKAIAIKLAEAGVKVAIVGRNEERAKLIENIIKEKQGEARYFLGDISCDEQCSKIVQEVYSCFGQIDILVNCAGILTSTSITEITKREWDNVIATNLSGTFFMIQKVIPYLKESKSGRIINISSNAGRMGGYENSQSYTASKGGIIAITLGIARQLAEDNITVNVVCPGTTETEMVQLYDEEKKEKLLKRIPLKRFGKPSEVAATVCFLASEEAGYITGAILDVNGGMFMG